MFHASSSFWFVLPSHTFSTIAGKVKAKPLSHFPWPSKSPPVLPLFGLHSSSLVNNLKNHTLPQLASGSV
jgi:hypothetical protein